MARFLEVSSWNERLDQALRMLTAPENCTAYCAEIGFRSGFIDMPTFNRMFKRRFGRTPSEARHAVVVQALASG